MNQVKIGTFISECRKAKGLTQNQLAEKLGITDKAVSKWETGRSMPDLSLFTPLCNLLEITLNELLAGEHIPEEELREKTDKVLMEVITNWLGHDKWELKEKNVTAKNVLNVQNISKRYETEDNVTLAVDNVSFQVPHGSFIGIMGASGSGKTTLLNLIATIDKPTSGNIEINGQSIMNTAENDMAKFRREHLGFVFQDYNLLETLTIYENIALALTIKEIPKEKIRQIIDESGLEQILKDRLYDKVNELEEALKECTTLNQKVTLIKKAMKEIQDIIDYYLTERNLGQALQMYDPFTKEDFLTLDLGLAVNEKDLPGVDSSLEDLKQQLLSASNQRSNSFDEIKEAYAEDLDEALKRATLEDNEALITAIANFRDALLTATPENIVEVIEVAKEEIKKALMEDPSGTKEDQAAEDAKEDISDAMQDALDKLEKEEAEEEDEIESEGEEDQEDQQEKPTVNPDKPFESEPIIDGNTPYLPEYEKYAEIINQILSSYEGEEIPEDVRKIIEEYLEMLK